jgi:hypothetical protein
MRKSLVVQVAGRIVTPYLQAAAAREDRSVAAMVVTVERLLIWMAGRAVAVAAVSLLARAAMVVTVGVTAAAGVAVAHA